MISPPINSIVACAVLCCCKGFHAAMHLFDVFVVYARVALVYEFDSDQSARHNLQGVRI